MGTDDNNWNQSRKIFPDSYEMFQEISVYRHSAVYYEWLSRWEREEEAL